MGEHKVFGGAGAGTTDVAEDLKVIVLSLGSSSCRSGESKVEVSAWSSESRQLLSLDAKSLLVALNGMSATAPGGSSGYWVKANMKGTWPQQARYTLSSNSKFGNVN